MSSPIAEELRETARAWASDDPDPSTREELERLLHEGASAELEDRFAGSLQFGTAGLRGLLGAGPNRMNRKVVLRATAGLCRYLLETTPDAAARGIAIGYDGRRLSREMAEDAATVVCGMGMRAYTFEHVVPTPLLAFTCLETNAAAGIVVTASHNPPDYNGYKVYWGNGAQIIPPHDEGIAARIAQVGAVDTIPRMPVAEARESGRLRVLGAETERRYLDGVRALQVHPELPRDLRIAYTALHGVGERLLRQALDEAGFTDVHSVAEQAEPDGGFPTVAFPNPEEKGAMDMVLALARERGAELVLANDPDADRLAVAVPDGRGGFVQLSGNEVGCLLAHYLLDQGRAEDARLVVNTIVSSPMLGAIARAHGAQSEQTLTGFKWIANRALERAPSARFVLGFEEALGYTVGTLVRDKDGIGTAVAFADLAAWCRSRGRTLLEELEESWRRYGMYLSRQVSKTLPGAEGRRRITGMMARVRSAPPRSLAGLAVEAVLDLELGERRDAEGRASPSGLPKGDVIALELAGDHRVMLRPSGTEPKIKFYFDVRVDVADGEAIGDARARGNQLVDELVGAFEAALAGA
jgi:phosphomannomutase